MSRRSAGSPRPPRLAERCIRRLLPPDVHGRTILGDLHEEHREIHASRGALRAGLWYWRQVLVVGVGYHRPDRSALEGLGQDLRHALRALRRSPGVSGSALVGTALAVGVGTAIFSVVDAVLLTPLPFERPEELVRVWASNEGEGEPYLDMLYEDVAWVESVGAFASAGGYSTAPGTLLDMQMQNPEDVSLVRTSEGFFETLGIPPGLGRLYGPEDAQRDRQLVVLSHGLWTRRFGEDPDVIGTTFHLDVEAFEVVGVLPEGIQFPEDADLWHALPPLQTMDDDRELQVLARLAPGAAMTAAADEVRSAAMGQAELDPEGHGGYSAWLQPLQATVVRDVRTALYAFLGAVGLILLITCVNTANLLFARAADRHHEIAVRTSLGAGRRRIVRYHLAESVLLAGSGGLAGLLLGHWVLKALLALTPRFPRLDTVALDGRVMFVMAGVVGLVGILSGVGPALSASATAPADALRDGGTGRTAAGSRVTLRSGLVASEIAMSTALVVLAVLLFGTFRAVLDHDRGFEAGDLIAFRVDPLHPPEGIDDNRDYYGRMLSGALGLPPVAEAALASHPILEQRGLSTEVTVEGRPAASGTIPEATVRMASDGYFQVARVPLLAGRSFGVDGGASEDLELVVNQTLVRRLLGGAADPLGAYLETEWFRGHVVGVVGDVSPSVGEPALPMIYVPFAQVPSLTSWLIVRTAPGVPSVVSDVWREVHAVDRYILSTRTVHLDESVRAAVAPQRFNMLVVAAFSGLALALAAVGIYGVTSYTVSARRAEIGIRRALGASRPRLASSVLGRLGALTAAGVLLGLIGAVAGERLVGSLLVGVRPGDPAVLLGVAALLAVVALAASAVPLARAMRVAPTEALRPD